MWLFLSSHIHIVKTHTHTLRGTSERAANGLWVKLIMKITFILFTPSPSNWSLLQSGPTIFLVFRFTFFSSSYHFSLDALFCTWVIYVHIWFSEITKFPNFPLKRLFTAFFFFFFAKASFVWDHLTLWWSGISSLCGFFLFCSTVSQSLWLLRVCPGGHYVQLWQ